MRICSCLRTLVIGWFIVLLSAPSQASAAPILMFTFSQSGFSMGATVAGSFTGTDVDGDGWLESFVIGEITAYSMSFSGNITVSAFSHTITDFATAGATGGLVYRLSGPQLLGDDITAPYEGISSGPLGGAPPPITQYAYRTGFGPTGLAQFGFVEDNTPFGMGSIDHTSAYVLITQVNQVPEPATLALTGLGLLVLLRRMRDRTLSE